METMRVAGPALSEGDATTAAAQVIGPEYTTADEIGRSAWRERYCLAQLAFYPDARLDPRSERSFIDSLVWSGLLERVGD